MIGERLERWIRAYRKSRLTKTRGAIGDFYRAGGAALLYDDLPLSDADTVLDIGGYDGDWTAEILARYGSRSVVVEAIPTAAQTLSRRFAHNKRVRIVGSALMAKPGRVRMSVAENGSSVRTQAGAPSVEVDALPVSDLLAMVDGDIGVVKMNIEGAEFDVLDEWSRLDALGRVRTWLIQFHDAVPDAAGRVARLAEALGRTHHPRFRHPFVWERWDRSRHV